MVRGRTSLTLPLHAASRYRHGMEPTTKEKKERRAIASRILADGRIVELVCKTETKRTQLAVWKEGKSELADSLDAGGGLRIVPIAASNSLIRHGAVLLPEAPAPYEDVATLVSEIEAYIGRYVALSDGFRRLAAHYILFTWVYDAFQEVPYLRVQAQWGAGKTRALIVIGSLCYRPFLASGASTVSPIFHTLDTFRGTLVLDEADFRFSDQTAELVKILNAGTVRGFPVFRTAITKDREFDPRAFEVFGPKIIAMRGSFADEALESRFITERMDGYTLPKGIPLNLPDTQRLEAQALRNQLLQYRFDHRQSARIDESLVDPALSPRLNQIVVPLLSVVPDAAVRAEIREAVVRQEAERKEVRAESVEGVLTSVLAELAPEDESGIPVSEIATVFGRRYEPHAGRPVSARYVGGLLRMRLGLATYKTNGTYAVRVSPERLSALQARYGVQEVGGEE